MSIGRWIVLRFFIALTALNVALTTIAIVDGRYTQKMAAVDVLLFPGLGYTIYRILKEKR